MSIKLAIFLIIFIISICIISAIVFPAICLFFWLLGFKNILEILPQITLISIFIACILTLFANVLEVIKFYFGFNLKNLKKRLANLEIPNAIFHPIDETKFAKPINFLLSELKKNWFFLINGLKFMY